MIFIDWISTKDHINFNRAFFFSLNVNNSCCFIFSKELIVDEIRCILIKHKNGRIARTLSIIQLCWRYRNDQIVFVTYDPVFLPIIFFIKKKIIVFEHNTTPEEAKLSKHFIWQKLFFRNIFRMAQFHGQLEILEKLTRHTAFVGTPLTLADRSSVNINQSKKYFIAPSYRASLRYLERAVPFIQGSRLVIKKSVYKKDIKSQCSGIFIDPVNRINLEEDYSNILGVIITVDSKVRGTGWFNDAIKYGIPVIITNVNANKIFKELFPGYPYINLVEINCQSLFNIKMREAINFNATSYVTKHNSDFKKRFAICCELAGWRNL